MWRGSSAFRLLTSDFFLGDFMKTIWQDLRLWRFQLFKVRRKS